MGYVTEMPRPTPAIVATVNNEIAFSGERVEMYACTQAFSRRRASQMFRSEPGVPGRLKQPPSLRALVRVPWVDMLANEADSMRMAPPEVMGLLGDGMPFTYMAVLHERETGEYRSWHWFACQFAKGMWKVREAVAEMDLFERKTSRRVGQRGNWQPVGKGRWRAAEEVAW